MKKRKTVKESKEKLQKKAENKKTRTKRTRTLKVKTRGKTEPKKLQKRP